MKKIVLIGLLAGVMLAGCGTNETPQQAEQPQKPTQQTQKAESKKIEKPVNYQNFLSIEIGATKSDVDTLLGSAGVETSSYGSGKDISTSYQYEAGSMEYIMISYENDIVRSKNQMGLDSGLPKEATLEKYNQVQNGMTLSEVEAIMGKGTLSDESKFGSYYSTGYSWSGKNGYSYMSASFDGDKLTYKSQGNLE